MRQSRLIMGMPVLLEIVDAHATQADYDTVFDYFTAVDARFSTYKEDSEISRINRGEISESSYSNEMKEVFALAKETERATDGYFNMHTPEGLIDPSGLVKGWAIQKAADLLRMRGIENFYVDIGGDIQTSGMNAEGKEWSIGIRNPLNVSDREEVVKIIYPHGKGVVTSGSYIRGSHIYNPHDSQHKPSEYLSLTVIGPNVYEADRFATPAFAMGKQGMYFLEGLEDFEAYAIDAKGMAVYTSGFEAYTLA
jgi:thiamine biosynthesis lipoprotein